MNTNFISSFFSIYIILILYYIHFHLLINIFIYQLLYIICDYFNLLLLTYYHYIYKHKNIIYFIQLSIK